MPATRAADEWEMALVDGGLVLLLFLLPYRIEGDALARFDALVQLLDRGRLTASAYSLAGPLFAAPLYYLGKLAGDPVWWCQRYNTLLLAAGFAAMVWLLREPAERAVLRKFFLVVLAASMFPNHLENFNSEPFTAVTIMVGVAALSAGRPLLGWTLAVIGVVNTPAAIVGLLFVATKCAVDRRRPAPLLAVAAAALLIALEATVRRGGPFVTGYENNAGVRTVMPYSGLPGFSYPIFFGLLSILFSFGKGLVFYAPGLLLPARKTDGLPPRLRECYQGWLLFLAGLVAVYSKWWAWYGGTSWGPRFFLAASLPASLAIAVRLRSPVRIKPAAAAATLAVLALSAWVGIDGAVFRQANLGICQQNDWAQEFLCWYVPEFSALWRPFVVPSPVSAMDMVLIAFFVVVFLTLSGTLMRDYVRSHRVPSQVQNPD